MCGVSSVAIPDTDVWSGRGDVAEFRRGVLPPVWSPCIQDVLGLGFIHQLVGSAVCGEGYELVVWCVA